MNGSQPNRIKSVERSFAIVNALQEIDGARVRQLSDHTGLAPSTVHRYLATLEQAGYVVKEGDEYNVGLGFLDIGEYARRRKLAYRLAKPKVDELAEETGERCQFVVEEHGRAVYVHVSGGSHAVETDSRVGKRLYLHATSVGKSILAHLPEERVEEIIDRWGLPAQTENTITDREKLMQELERIRERGFAYNREGNVAGLRSVGAAAIGPDGRVAGAFSVSGPTHRMKNERYDDELPNLILGTVNELELNLKYA